MGDIKLTITGNKVGSFQVTGTSWLRNYSTLITGDQGCMSPISGSSKTCGYYELMKIINSIELKPLYNLPEYEYLLTDYVEQELINLKNDIADKDREEGYNSSSFELKYKEGDVEEAILTITITLIPNEFVRGLFEKATGLKPLGKVSGLAPISYEKNMVNIGYVDTETNEDGNFDINLSNLVLPLNVDDYEYSNKGDYIYKTEDDKIIIIPFDANV